MLRFKHGMVLRVTNRSLGKTYEPAHKEDLCVRESILTASIELESLPPVPIVNVKKILRFPLRTAAKDTNFWCSCSGATVLVMAIKSLYMLRHVYLSS